jgi:hypothetical protein
MPTPLAPAKPCVVQVNCTAGVTPIFTCAAAAPFGPEHPSVAIRLNNLALLLSDTKRLAEAEPLYRCALAIYEKSFGPEHPNVAIRLNNVALLLYNANRLAGAEPLYRPRQISFPFLAEKSKVTLPIQKTASLSNRTPLMHGLERSTRHLHLDATSSLARLLKPS